MMVVDASVWASVLLEADLHHGASVDWLGTARMVHWNAAVPAHFPAEVAGVLRRVGVSSQTVTAEIEFMFAGRFFEIHEVDRELARLSADIAERSAMRGADAVYVALAGLLRFPLLSWDKQQRARGALFCRTMTPVEAMEMAG
jgi:predicted nucleic acid-binding protein